MGERIKEDEMNEYVARRKPRRNTIIQAVNFDSLTSHESATRKELLMGA
jgi:hypothetical protein